jgi:hypothetical protein
VAVYNCSPNDYTADFTLLRKLWRCVGLSARGDDAGSDQQSQAWKGKEVLTTLLACLGFAWHDDVSRLWDHCKRNDDDADTVNECACWACIHGCAGRHLIEVQNTVLDCRGCRWTLIGNEIRDTAMLRTSRFKLKELQDLAPYVTQLNAFLDARQQSAFTEVRALVLWWWVSCRAVCRATHSRATSSSSRSRRESRW